MTEKSTWKTLAIVGWILFLLMVVLIILGYMDVIDEDKKTYECLYEICEDNYDAEYLSPICTCYDLDVIGNYVVDKQKYMD